mgnify:CR=1 FL=1
MVTTMNTDPQATARRHTVAAVFDNEDRTVSALEELKSVGFTADHVSVVLKDARESAHIAERTDMAGEGAAAGAVTGGVSALVIPGIGPIVGTGILVSTLAGAGIGAAAGELVGALASQGIPEEDARGYERHVSEGRTLVTVGAASEQQAAEAERILHAHGGADVRSYGLDAA